MGAQGNTSQDAAKVSQSNSNFPQTIVDWQDCELLQDEPKPKKLPKPSSSQYASIYNTVKPKVKTRQTRKRGPSPRGTRTNQTQAQPSTLRQRPPWDNFLRSPSNKRYPREISKPSKDEIWQRQRWKLQMEEAAKKRRQVCSEIFGNRKSQKPAREQQMRSIQHQNIQNRYEKKLEAWEKSARDRKRANKEFLKLKSSVQKQKLLHERLHEEFEQSASDAESERHQLYNQSLHRMRVLRPCDIIASNALEQLRKEVGNVYNYGMRSRSDPVQRKPATCIRQNATNCIGQSPGRLGLTREHKSRLVDRAVSPIQWETAENTPMEEDQLLDRLTAQKEEAVRVTETARKVNAEEDVIKKNSAEV